MKLDLAEEFLSGRVSCEAKESAGEEILEGTLTLDERRVPIRAGIPRFVQDDGYADNFGLQWVEFKRTQYDSQTGLPLTFDRFWHHTRWLPRDLYGKRVLEAGSGAGRFTEIMLEAGARVCSFDLSRAVDTNFEQNRGKGELFLFQADIDALPVPDQHFDFVFCYGVLQHLPNPERAYRTLFSKLRPGGQLSIDYYLKSPALSPWSTPKYFWRPVTADMDPELLLKIISVYVPLWLPIDTALRRVPRVGHKILASLRIPCWNYSGTLPLKRAQIREWAIMDTFDALGARYDQPKTLDEVRAMVESDDNALTDVFYGSNGVVANVTRRA